MGNANLHINMTTLGKYAGCFENAIANYLLEIYASIGV
jgi:hypothetical protein